MKKRKLNSERLREWIDEHGVVPSENRIREVTGYSLGTLQKMRDGSYPHCPNFAGRRALMDLTGLGEDELFPLLSNEDTAS